MTICGLWQGGRRLAAAIAGDDGVLRPAITTPATPEHTNHVLDYLVAAGVDTLILDERSQFLITGAHARRLRVRLVPHDLLEGIREATAMTQRPPRYTAVLLARWPFAPALRVLLREARPSQPQKHQIPLF